MTFHRRSFFSHFAAAATATLSLPAQSPARKSRNVVLVSTDGLRWQDVFRGADPALLNKHHGGVVNLEATRREFWRQSPADRRRALMPFLWSTLAKDGQLYGNRDLGSDAYLTNGRNFSYPGYNELLAGFADHRIDSNDKKNNANVTVLEWLNRKPEYRGKVAAFAAWDCFPFILNEARSGILVNAGYEPYKSRTANPNADLLNRLKIETGIWEGEPMDAPVFRLAMEHLRIEKPRVLYVALGDTDEWAHEGRYDLYLSAARRVDQYLAELWETLQSLPAYRDCTTLLVAVDHGRGTDGVSWRSHGEKLPDSRYVWLGILGPDTPAKGERASVAAITQNQIAATLAAFLAEDYRAATPQAGPSIADALR
jgi:hypothetical protein